MLPPDTLEPSQPSPTVLDPDSASTGRAVEEHEKKTHLSTGSGRQRKGRIDIAADTTIYTFVPKLFTE